MPRVFVIIDELSELMTSYEAPVRSLLHRLITRSGKCGIHIIISTSNLTESLLTPELRANLLNRISFRTDSIKESEMILDSGGAEKLLTGEMLFLPSDFLYSKEPTPLSVKCEELSEYRIKEEIQKLKEKDYCCQNEIKVDLDKYRSSQTDSECFIEDSLMDGVSELISKVDEFTISMLQRRFRIGYYKAVGVAEELIRSGRAERKESGIGYRVLK